MEGGGALEGVLLLVVGGVAEGWEDERSGVGELGRAVGFAAGGAVGAAITRGTGGDGVGSSGVEVDGGGGGGGGSGVIGHDERVEAVGPEEGGVHCVEDFVGFVGDVEAAAGFDGGVDAESDGVDDGTRGDGCGFGEDGDGDCEVYGVEAALFAGGLLEGGVEVHEGGFRDAAGGEDGGVGGDEAAAVGGGSALGNYDGAGEAIWG